MRRHGVQSEFKCKQHEGFIRATIRGQTMLKPQGEIGRSEFSFNAVLCTTSVFIHPRHFRILRVATKIPS